MLLSLVTFILVLGLLVFVHELGHFVVAKWTGMKVEEFALGFPPRLWSRKRGETTYAVNALPLGGYVKIAGENPADDEGGSRSFQRRPIWARMAVSVAGVVMNLVLAFVVLTIAFSVGFSSISQDLATVPGAHVLRARVLVADVLPGSAAEHANVQPGTQISSITDLDSNQGQSISQAGQLQEFTKRMQAQGHRDTLLDLVRPDGSIGQQQVAINLTGPALGVSLAEDAVVRVPFWRAPGVAAHEVVAIADVTGQALGSFGADLFRHGKLQSDVSGPIGIYQATSTAAHEGFAAVVFLTVVLSVNLALLNILPIPALDGGKLLFLVIEALFRRRVVPEHVEATASTVGFALLMILIVTLSVRDLIRL